MDSIHELEMILKERKIPFNFEEVSPYCFIFYPSRFNTVFTVSTNKLSEDLHILAKDIDVNLPCNRVANIISEHYFSFMFLGGGRSNAK